MNIGIIGCGNISGIYFENLSHIFPDLRIAACSDLDMQKAKEAAKPYGVKACCTGELLDDPEVDIVLNLTTPGGHARINRLALEKGKHVYCEKPFALNREDGQAVLDLAGRSGLRTGCAPDTFLGAGLQSCRKILDEGIIGEVHSAYAFMLCPGHESWHPGPDFYYKPGGGPMLDMGPYYLTALASLLGPIASVNAKTGRAFEERICTAEETRGRKISVETWTDYKGLIEFESGATGLVCMSFDVFGSQMPRIELHGTKGSLWVPDPNTFGGPVRLFRKGAAEAVDIPLYAHCYEENSRGIGLADMAEGIRLDRPHRADGTLAMHVLDAMLAFEDSAAVGSAVNVTYKPNQFRPDALPLGLETGRLH